MSSKYIKFIPINANESSYNSVTYLLFVYLCENFLSMRKNKYILFTILASTLLLFGCSSVDGDARKAAELNRKSIDYAQKNDLEKAEEVYKESQAIVNQYKDTEHYNEFYTAYSRYMEEVSDK